MNKAIDERLVELLCRSDRILIFTGAGISTGSGIPDFRGPQGVWKERMPVYYQDFMSSEKARIEYWDYKLEGKKTFENARPNEVHNACALIERVGKLEMLVTQNIDGLHSAAGTSREKLVEMHGTNSFVECQSCGERSEPEPHFEYFEKHRRPPICKCEGFLKPATISFGQSLREEDLRRAFAAAEKTDLAISLGSTLSVHPAASVPLAAAQRGIPYVIINRGVTDQDGHPAVTLRLEGDVSKIFPPAVKTSLGR
ncbi:MAG: Sir2 family NAD-dependent protein deacetylase [Deltaproteobacteria bacterium]|nr:MAG: Sir2 family NAD-dependent protein deacetylase [Deltaproteobacteria bacterium]